MAALFAATASLALGRAPPHHVTVGPGQAPGGKPQSYSAGLALAIFLISRRSAKVNFGGRPPYFGYSEPNPSALKLRITSRTRSSLVKATFAIPLQPAPWGACPPLLPRLRVDNGGDHAGSDVIDVPGDPDVGRDLPRS